MNDVLIDGAEIYSELDVHRTLERQLEFGQYYGRNFAALRDRLSVDVSRPVRLTWSNSATSREHLGNEVFERFVEIFEEIARQDVAFGWDDKFEFELL
jgi:ribonuclease inhibitor